MAYDPATGSTVLATPLSAAMICCVRSAIRADSSVGSASASSRPLQCSDWVPPSTAASACSATRTMLLSGCCAVSVLPAVWAWKRSCCARGFVAPNRSRISRAHRRRAARNFAISSRKLLWALKKNDSRCAELIDIEPGLDGGRHVGDGVGEREGHLLHGGRPGLADVIAADRNRVPLGQLALAEREDVGDDPQRGARRVDVGAARDVLLENVVLDRARERGPRHLLPPRHRDVQGQEDDRRRIDGHRCRHPIERDGVEEAGHVLHRVDRDADPADFSGGQRVIGVVAHLRRQIERHAETGDAVLQQIPVSGIGLRGAAEARVLPHRP